MDELPVKKPGRFLRKKNISILTEVNAKSQIYAGEEAWNIVAGAEKVHIASGKKIVEFNPTSANKEEILTKITGRTGNLRAPTLKRENIIYVGYNADMYEQI